MAFDGTWKVERSENYEKFMEALGKALSNPFHRKSVPPAEQHKLQLSESDSWLLCPCIRFQNILSGEGKDAEKCSDFNYT